MRVRQAQSCNILMERVKRRVLYSPQPYIVKRSYHGGHPVEAAEANA